MVFNLRWSVSCLGVRTGMVPIGFVTFAVLRSPSFDD